jgi:DNA-binding MarR family transcriptional regulator
MPEALGREAGLSHDDHQAVRLWLRLLTCSTQIEQVIRSQLRAQFGTTLPRFDYLAQLSRFPKGLRMKTLSEYLMVTGGNVTGLTDQLVAEGWVERVADEEDRRAMIVRLTRTGKKQFGAMAAAHEQWLEQLLAPLGGDSARELYEQLGRLRLVLSQSKSD